MPSSVNLGSNLDGVIEQLVSVGRYGSRSEVLRAGVRLVQEREAQLAILNARLDEGIADSNAGRTHGADDVFDELERKYDALAAAAHP